MMHTLHTQQYNLILHVSAVTLPSPGSITHQHIVDILKYDTFTVLIYICIIQISAAVFI